MHVYLGIFFKAQGYTITYPLKPAVLLHMAKSPKLLPGKAYTSAGSIGITEDACGNGLAEWLQHVLQFLLVHGQRQIGDV